MIGLSATVSGADVASGLYDDPEGAALMLDALAGLMDEQDRAVLSEWIKNMDGMERERIAVLGALMVEAARD